MPEREQSTSMDLFLHFFLFHFTASKLPFLLRGVNFSGAPREARQRSTMGK